VVGRGQNERVGQLTGLTKLLQETAHRLVHVGNLGAIEIGRVTLPEQSGRSVGRMRVVEMNEDEPALGAARADPVESGAENGVGRPLGYGKVVEVAGIAVKVVVELEALVEAEAGIERE